MSVADKARREELNDIKIQMDTERGRKFLCRILVDLCGTFAPTLDTDHGRMSFNEGMRNVGRKLYGDIMDVAPKKYIVMCLEAKERSELLVAQLNAEREMNNEAE